MDPMLIEARGLTKLYGLVIGLNDVTLDLRKGVHGLLGPNGAGKSTFLKLLTGQLRPTSGTVWVLGQQPWANGRLLRRVGFCPEQDSFHDFLTGLDFVTTLCQMHGFARAEARRRAEAAMERVGLSEQARRPIRTYSKGMRQRTKIAQAIAHDPELLILDEPLTGTDPLVRRQLVDLIKGIAAEGKSVLVSSHILHEVEAMTDRFLLFMRGRVLAAGTVHEIRDLMNEYPHRITLRSDRVGELARALLGELPVSGLEIDPERGSLTLLTRRPREFYERLPGIVLEGKFELKELSSQDDHLDAVFKYLTQGAAAW